ncbi:DUF7322 domain-containing protein [Halorhabdus amylolytica]|uniref:DUF7322 domain-containing protein n=1 Tax=Halorhabdus amylolytica TaxID=2559573 RepID=UPI0010A9E068|nr:hypothetical protein [Halorhabdus amylolytica]
MSGSDPFDDFFEEGAASDDDLIPTVDVPEPKPAEGDFDSDVVKLFWRLVLVFNVALFGVTVGPMVLYFLGDFRIGMGLLAVGGVAGGYGFVRYRRFVRTRADDSEGPI